jgi:two-component system cell cycle sensor histidine kinase/response regulator CckA
MLENAGKKRPASGPCADARDLSGLAPAENAFLFETIFDAIPDVLGIQDIHHGMIRMNPAGYAFFRKSPAELAGMKCYQLICRNEPCPTCPTRKTLRTGKPASCEKYLPHLDKWLDLRSYPIRDKKGRVCQVIEHWRDISDIKRAETCLRESEEKYRILVENANEAIFILQDGEFKFPNSKAYEMARALELDFERYPFTDYIHPDDRQMVMERYEQRIKDVPLPQFYSFKLQKKDGTTFWVELNAAKITWEGRPATLNFMRDITRQKRLEDQFREAQKMESLGTLAGGIAHDFNNLLMGIQGNVSLLYLETETNASLQDKLGSIEKCVESGSSLTKQLLGFARGGKYVVKSTDINKILHSSSLLFGRTRREIKIHCNFQKDIWYIEVDQGQIEQALFNLYLNAWQAMEAGGDIFLKTDNVNLDPESAKLNGVSEGRYVKISVTDTGIGMDPATRQRIFEPFFTTKAINRGTGLGLASVFGIVKNHNGFITVESALGEGSTFALYFPATDKTPQDIQPRPEYLMKGSETILLIDDEHYILEVGRLMLKGLGYKILTANCGRAGIEIFTAHQSEIDMVVLDIIMPDIGGAEVFERIRRKAPHIKVLLSSGYNVDFQASDLLEKGCNGFIQKPFNLKQFSQIIREILDS